MGYPVNLSSQGLIALLHVASKLMRESSDNLVHTDDIESILLPEPNNNALDD
jgi:hypothetical protein